jgi:hypothetical protein
MVLLAVLAGGCGSTATVSGEVTVDGKPIDKGVISYVPADDKGAPATAPIENGRYELKTRPGNKRVQISQTVVVGKRDGYEITEERLPARFHSRTELTFEVQSGANTRDWNLETKARKP